MEKQNEKDIAELAQSNLALDYSAKTDIEKAQIKKAKQKHKETVVKTASQKVGRTGRKRQEEKEDLPYSFNKELFGERLKEIRKDGGDNQIELAEKLHLTSAMLTLYEKGSSLPPLDILFNIAKIYGVSIDYLMGISNKVQPQKDGQEIKVEMPCPALPTLKEIESGNTFILQVVDGQLKILKAE